MEALVANSQIHEGALMEKAVVEILNFIGEDAGRSGLLDTPKRVAKAYKEICSGYGQSASEILSTSFDMDDVDSSVSYTGIVMLRDIEFYSLCEHHMLPFVGKAHIGYIPNENGKVVGLSKLARLVDVFARRLQCQERLTAQIANALVENLNPKGAIVIMEAEHFCMKMRGIGKQNSVMLTSEVRGVFEYDPRARAEALGLLKR